MPFQMEQTKLQRSSRHLSRLPEDLSLAYPPSSKAIGSCYLFGSLLLFIYSIYLEKLKIIYFYNEEIEQLFALDKAALGIQFGVCCRTISLTLLFQATAPGLSSASPKCPQSQNKANLWDRNINTTQHLHLPSRRLRHSQGTVL